MTKIYLVRYGEYSDQGIAGAFSTEEKAQKYCDIQNEILEYKDFWVDEYVLDEEEVPKEAKVVTYYTACIALEDNRFTKSGEIYRTDEDRRIYTKDVEIEIDKSFNMIEVASTKSLEHAKKVAIEQYQIYTQQKLEDGEI